MLVYTLLTPRPFCGRAVELPWRYVRRRPLQLRQWQSSGHLWSKKRDVWCKRSPLTLRRRPEVQVGTRALGLSLSSYTHPLSCRTINILQPEGSLKGELARRRVTCAAESRAQGLSDGCKTVSSVITDDGARTATAAGTLDRTLSTAATTVTRFLASGLEREHTLGAPPRTQYHVPTMVPATKPYADILAEYAKEWQDESTSGW